MTLNYGAFLQAMFDFILVAIAVFVLVKAINRLKASLVHPPAASGRPHAGSELLTEIRDALAKSPRV